MAGFNPKEHMMKMSGKDYLPVNWRVVWFRDVHPAGAITTDLIATEPVAIVRASVHGADGVVLATGYGSCAMAGKGSYAGRGLEKAETSAIGRALKHAGFGTEYDDEDDSDYLADAPVDPPRTAEPPAHGWTRDQAASLVTEAKQKHVTNDELLGLLGVARISDYAPGFSAARELLTAYAKDRTAPAAENGVVF